MPQENGRLSLSRSIDPLLPPYASSIIRSISAASVPLGTHMTFLLSMPFRTTLKHLNIKKLMSKYSLDSRELLGRRAIHARTCPDHGSMTVTIDLSVRLDERQHAYSPEAMQYQSPGLKLAPSSDSNKQCSIRPLSYFLQAPLHLRRSRSSDVSRCKHRPGYRFMFTV